MVKAALAVLAIICGISIVSNYLFWSKSEEKIAGLEKDRDEYRAKYESIISKGDSLQAVADSLEMEADARLARIDSLEAVVEDLEQTRLDELARIEDTLFQPHEYVDRLRELFPQLQRAPMGIVKTKHPRTGLDYTAFQIPVHFVETFIEDAVDVRNYAEQVDNLREINVTFREVVTLKDSINTLIQEKAEAYREGLDYGIAKYDSLVADYISTLKNPPKIGFPSVGTILGVGAAGVAAGALISK